MSIYTLLRQFDAGCGPISLYGSDKDRFGGLWDQLLANDLLKGSGTTKYAPCNDPECGGTGEVRFFDETSYIDCSVCLKMGKIDPERLCEWKLNLGDVLRHIKNALKLTGEFFEIKRGEWQLGFYKGTKVVFCVTPDVLLDVGTVICLSLAANSTKNVLELSQAFAFPFNCNVETSIFDTFHARIQKQSSRPLEVPQYSYAGFEVFCETDPPFGILDIKFKSEALYRQHKSIRLPDWEVLRSLVKGQGSVVKRLDLLSVLKGTSYDEELGSDSELNAAISRLRKVLGVNIETAKKVGYSLSAEQTLRKMS